VKTGWRWFGLGLATVLVSVIAIFAGPVSLEHRGVLNLRLARILLANVAGAGLSVSGAIFQATLRNPLAEPYILGVASGGGLGAAIAILFGLGLLGAWTLPAAAFLGALLTMLLVYSLARVRGRIPIYTLLLSGVVVAALFNSMLVFLISVAPVEGLRSVTWWLLGNLSIFDRDLLAVVAIAILVGIGVTALFARDLNVLLLGEEPAAHLGLRVERLKRLFFALGSLMTGAAVAACGLIGFVGLIVPHIGRQIVGPDHRRLLPVAAMGGAMFLVAADTLAQLILAPYELPVGVITAVLGGPFFIVLLRRQRRMHWI